MWLSLSPVNIAAVADVMEINAALVRIEFVEHSVITDPQFEFGAALESFVREAFQPLAHLIHLALDSVADRPRQGIEGLRKRC